MAQKWKQTTFRIDAALLRDARYFLDIEGKSVASWIGAQLQRYVYEQRKQHQQTPLPPATKETTWQP